MDFYNLVANYPKAPITAAMLLGGLIWSLLNNFWSRFFVEMADNIAKNINLPDQILRIFAEQNATAQAIRIDTVKSEGTMKILGLMAEIEHLVFDWRQTAYFHLDEIKDEETVEDLGLKDLKRVSQLLTSVSRESSAYSLYFNDELRKDIANWISEIYKLNFKSYGIYLASKELNKSKSPAHTDRIVCVSDLMKEKFDPHVKFIGDLRKVVHLKFSKILDIPV